MTMVRCGTVMPNEHLKYCITVLYVTDRHTYPILWIIIKQPQQTTVANSKHTGHKLPAIPQTILSATIWHHDMVDSTSYKAFLHHLPAWLIGRNLQYRCSCLWPA